MTTLGSMSSVAAENVIYADESELNPIGELQGRR